MDIPGVLHTTGVSTRDLKGRLSDQDAPVHTTTVQFTIVFSLSRRVEALSLVRLTGYCEVYEVVV